MYLTIFTSTYNRKLLLTHLYNSLIEQTVYNFEWIVIDDGSNDGTSELLKQWQNEQKNFEIVYLTVPNGGKHRAINKGIQLARGEFFYIVDSDDYITNDAVEFILSRCQTIIDNDLFSGIVGLKQIYSTGENIGGTPDFKEYIDAGYLERDKYNLSGDKAEVFKTEILKKYPFPEFEGENFVSEGTVWNQIALDGYKMRWFNKVIYMCDYLSDGLTKNIYNILACNPRGWAARIKIDKKFEQDITMFKAYFKFYEVFHDIYSENRIIQILDIDKNMVEQLSEAYQSIMEWLKEITKDKTVAIYGLGVNGSRVLEYFKKLEKPVEYIVDHNKVNSYIPSYRSNERLPDVEVICVTSRKISDDEIKGLLQEKKSVKVFYIWEHDERVW